MYIRGEFREDRPEILHAAIREIQFASLVTQGDGEFSASHLPTVLKTDGAHAHLECHVARANPQWKGIGSGIDALAIFLGPHTYISPSWYETKREHQKVVPTWNYISIQVSGTLRIVEDPTLLLQHLNELTDQNEATREVPWSVSDAPADFIEQLSKSIVGLRFDIRSIQGVWKMSQNRSEADRHGTIEGLAGSDQANAQLVRDEMMRLDRKN